MPQPYTKVALTFSDQLVLMLSRGMNFADPTNAEPHLRRIGYYRLSAYSHPFRQPASDNFVIGTSFERVVELYEFDRKLRLLLLDAIERVEIQVRTFVTYHVGHAFGAFGHTNSTNFSDTAKHSLWLQKLHDETGQSSETFVAHYKNKYDSYPDLPLWMATELMSVGSLSRMFSILRHSEQAKIADEFSLRVPVFRSWLHTIVYVRNLCAHHARVWNRSLAITPMIPRNDSRWVSPVRIRSDRLFVVLLVLRNLLRAHGGAGSWHSDVVALLSPETANPQSALVMGMPANWEKHSLWI